MVAQAAGVDRLGHEVVAERVHLDQRRHLGGVAEVVGIGAAGQARRGLGLDGDDAVGLAAAEGPAQPREGQAGEVRAAAGAADDHLRLLAGHLHLEDRLLADDRLMQEHEVEDRSQRVLRPGVGDRVLDGLADGDAQRTRVVGRLGQHLAAVLRVEARAGHDLGAVGLHEIAAVRLLVVARADHVDLDLEAEHGAGEGQRAAPLAGAGLGREPGHALGLVVVRLRQGRVGLVAAGRAAALVLVVDVGRRIERRLESMRAIERRRPIERVRVEHRLGDLDLAVGAHDLAR